MPYANIFHILVLLTRPTGGESVPEHHWRVGTIVQAVSDESRLHAWGWGRDALVAMTLTIFQRETRLSRVVHAGGRGKYGSDEGRAKCLGQLHKNNRLTEDIWKTLGGIDYDSTRRCARWTMKMIIAQQKTCAQGPLNDATLRASFEAYGAGNCKGKAGDTENRLKLFKRMSKGEK